ncbi:hypothetical protein FRB99_008745 [Tulasnella sp. 403]|nr:hypothetical protein FRB99_008745 [Tulasnella sp. 403]
MSGAVVSRLLPTWGAAFGLQTALATICVPLATEKFYDLGGALGFLSTAFVSLYAPYLRERFWLGNKAAYFPPLNSHAPRQILLTGALVLWATRLGSFLATRVFKTGKDSRFDELKHQPLAFSGMWIGQAMWVSLVGLPVWLVNALPASAHPPLRTLDYAGLALFSTSFLFEIIADYQKTKWRNEKNAKKHDEAFISRGLWSISRHPNYVGEVGVWAGIWIAASSVMNSSLLPPGMRLASTISPLFTYLLLTRVSGVPPLEISGDKRLGGDPKYQAYKRNTPIFFPWGPKGDFKP